MADDIDAPHDHVLTLDRPISLAEAVTTVARSGYLAAIAGGRATWIAHFNDRPIAVVAQQWHRPRFLPGDLDEPRTEDRIALYFRYRTQNDPDAEFAALAADG